MKRKKIKPIGLGITKKESEKMMIFDRKINRIIDRDCGYTSSEILSLTRHPKIH